MENIVITIVCTLIYGTILYFALRRGEKKIENNGAEMESTGRIQLKARPVD